MKVCNKLIAKEDRIDRYCSTKCDKGNCLGCRLNDAKSLIFKMQKCTGENVDCEKCETINKFRKNLPSISNRLAKVR